MNMPQERSLMMMRNKSFEEEVFFLHSAKMKNFPTFFRHFCNFLFSYSSTRKMSLSIFVSPYLPLPSPYAVCKMLEKRNLLHALMYAQNLSCRI